MKLAYVHDRLMMGGAKNVLIDIIEVTAHHHETRIYCPFSEHQSLVVNGKPINVITAVPHRIMRVFLRFQKHNVPLLSKLFDYRNMMPIFPLLTTILSRKIRAYKPDHTIISSFACVKNIDIPGSKTIYFHQPMQYIWTHYQEYVDNFKPKPLMSAVYKRVSSYLRPRDTKSTHFDNVYFNSFYTKNECQKLYHVDGQVLYPKIPDLILHHAVQEAQSYFVFVGRLVVFLKECKKIIQLFNETGFPLIMMGSGPDELYLKSIANDNIKFVGTISNVQEKINIIGKSRGLINITKESFGIGTVEALSLGVPVFGYEVGASSELVDIDSGVLVPNKNHETLVKYFKKFESTHFDRTKIKERILSKLKPHSDRGSFGTLRV